MASLSENSSEEMKKRKRKQSNRESAKRSRMRKQKHLDDLMVQIAHLRRDNSQIVTTLQVTTRELMGVEANNSVLRAQMNELTNRLNSLDGILSFMNTSATDTRIRIGIHGGADSGPETESMGAHWSNIGCVSQQPIIASADYNVLGY